MSAPNGMGESNGVGAADADAGAATATPQVTAEMAADIRAQVQARLKRIEGQVRGLQRMVAEDRYCPEVLVQIASVHEALRGVGKLLMRRHLEHCVTNALRSGNAVAAERAYDEVMELMYRHVR